MKSLLSSIFFLFFLFGKFPLSAQKIKIATAKYKMVVESYMSLDKAKEIATREAKLIAIDLAFGGSNMTGVTTLRLENKNTESNLEVNSYTNRIRKGVWINDIIKPDCKKISDDKNDVIECEVRGRVRELSDFGFNLEMTPLKSIDKYSASTDFKHRQQFYFYFKSPIDGFVSIYIGDKESVGCILPYVNMTSSTYKVNADQEYIFFKGGYDKENNVAEDPRNLLLTGGRQSDANLFYVFFSKKDFSKPVMESKSTSPKRFENWMSKTMADEDMFMKIIPVSIVK